jgi:hypothetical protein
LDNDNNLSDEDLDEMFHEANEQGVRFAIDADAASDVDNKTMAPRHTKPGENTGVGVEYAMDKEPPAAGDHEPSANTGVGRHINVETVDDQERITCDIPGAFMQTDMDELIHIKLPYTDNTYIRDPAN